VKLAYFVHDLNDPAVHRRVRMLHAGGATVRLVGFCRGEPPALVDGIAPVLLGRTEDAWLLQRAAAVAGALLALPRLRTATAGADAIVARQLETLAVAAGARQCYAPSAPLVFECLDIHRLMSARGPPGWLLRMIERALLRRCQGLMVSSSAFVGAYFARVHARLPPVFLVENKVLSLEVGEPPLPGRSRRGAERAAGPPWRIGWYGVIRCARSLRLLAGLAASYPGAVEIVIRGRVASSVLPDFDAVLAANPGLVFGGAYDRSHDLARLYGDVHFAWAIDFYEAGGNSEWLLPNRLYEASLFGAVPIALADVATGAWLARRGMGALLHGAPERALHDFFAGLDTSRYEAMTSALADVPDTAFLHTVADCEHLVRGLTAARVVPAPLSTARAKLSHDST
jgi:hypothetical protein